VEIDKQLISKCCFFGSQVIAVILAVLLDHGNGRAITSTSNDNIERMLGLAEKELNTLLNETNENPTEREENPADVLRLSEPDSSSHEAVQSQFNDESIIKGSKEANPVWRRKRSLDDEPECYTGVYKTITLAHAGLIAYPECSPVAFTACTGSIAQYGKRRCVPSNYKYYTMDNAKIPTKCSCAV